MDAVHQINSTYYSACEEDDLTYLLARAIQFFCPGVPLVYYNGMLAGVNDAEAVRRTGVPREINRPNYSYEDAAKQVGGWALPRIFRLYVNVFASWKIGRFVDRFRNQGFLPSSFEIAGLLYGTRKRLVCTAGCVAREWSLFNSGKVLVSVTFRGFRLRNTNLKGRAER